jgi:N-acetylglucosaminyldiphosphoundecaprenol N-acetyl-beta-D-mannosaminyltransferase
MKILGLKLYDNGFESAVAELIHITKSEPKNCCISASDAHVLVLSKTKPDFAQILHSFYWNLPDGVPSVWLLKLKGAKQASRISGPPFFEAVIKATIHLPINHFLCGGTAGVADDLKDVCKVWGNQNIVGTSSPPFRELTETDYVAIAQEINQSHASIVWVGLGAPKQIYFANELAKYVNLHAIITIGAAFDFHTNRIKKAPKWIQKIGLEWFYRLVQEPKRLFKRYVITIPKFIWFGIGDVFRKN